jgi:hypothetical protein
MAAIGGYQVGFVDRVPQPDPGTVVAGDRDPGTFQSHESSALTGGGSISSMSSRVSPACLRAM